MKIHAAVLYDMNLQPPYAESKPLKIEELDLDGPNQDEVLIQIKAAGLCHSDLSVINGNRPRVMPMALGHEAAGIVMETGGNVRDFKVGDHVVCTFVPSCGHCLPCREGRPALCEPGARANTAGTLLSGGHRLHKGDQIIHHHLGVSGFAEYAVVSPNSLVKVDDEVPLTDIAVFGCAIITGVGAVVNTARIKPGSTVAVVGLGGIGLSAILGANLSGARKIVAVDTNVRKLKMAIELGATDTYDAKSPDVVQLIREDTSGGVDYAFETAGVVAAMQTAYAITKRGGMTVTTGLPHPDAKFAFPQVSLAAEERTIKGSYLGSCVPSRDIPRFVELYKQGRLPVNKLLTDRLRLQDINEGFDRLAKGDAARLIVTL